MAHHLPSVAVILIASLSFTACTRDANRWQESDAVAAKPEAVTVEQAGGDERVVLFAPLALGDLAPIYPDQQPAHPASRKKIKKPTRPPRSTTRPPTNARYQTFPMRCIQPP